ncbi:MAG: molybdenum cofactor guanylyltransferase [bacterium]|nr:molybdenum cofactor guanylyltransferase [bacterium]
MKQDKAFLDIGGKMLIERVLEVVTPLFSNVLINSNTPRRFERWGVPVIPDVFPNTGPLGGIYTGLVHARTDHVFCVACDLPFLNPDLIAFMQTRASGCDVLVPKTSDGLHPLHAVYSRRCRTTIEARLREGRFKIFDLFPLVETRYVDEGHIRRFEPELKTFVNVNTLEELQLARKMQS